MTDLAVVGAGITGLAAAWEGLRRGADVVVLEAGTHPGGKLRTSPLGDLELDDAADAFLARVPEARELCAELGIDGDLVAPATGSAFVWANGELRRLPSQQLLGVPTDLVVLAESRILSPEGLARAREDLTQPDDRPDGDEAIGALVRRRLGDEVLDRLTAPLIGGVWAGDCDRLSLQVAAPPLAAARQLGPSLLRSAAEVRAEAENAALATEPGARPAPPVFLAPRGGMQQLVDAIVGALGGRLRGSMRVGAVARDGHRWRLEPAGVVADRVVIATPAFAAAPLVEPVAPAAAAALAAIEYASVVLVSLTAPEGAVDRPLDGSGLLVPRSEGRIVTACSWASSKWAHLAGDGSRVVLRASAGHIGDNRPSAMDDDALVAAVLEDLGSLMSLRGRPTAVRVSRWPQSLPQPRPGHLRRVASIANELVNRAPGVSVAGAWENGVGIPACIRSGRTAAAALLSGTGEGGPEGR